MIPEVSVIIPVYNVEKYLRECLDSVLGQTLQNIEVICINDGSTDGSEAILEEYAARDSRIRVVTQKNGGLNAARNSGLDQVTGEYIAIVDSDDWISPYHCEHTLRHARKTGADMTMFFFECVGFPDGRSKPVDGVSHDDKTEWREKLTTVTYLWQVCWAHLWNASFIRKNGLRFHAGLMFADELAFTFRAALLANRISILPEKLYFYRYRKNSITGDRTHPRILQLTQAYNFLLDDLQKDPIPEECWRYLVEQKWISLYYQYLNGLPWSFRRKFCRIVRSGEHPYERTIVDQLAVSPRMRIFFTALYGSGIHRWAAWLRWKKARFADMLARKLVSHSWFLQELVEKGGRGW